jgi:hypothetical protein
MVMVDAMGGVKVADHAAADRLVRFALLLSPNLRGSGVRDVGTRGLHFPFADSVQIKLSPGDL